MEVNFTSTRNKDKVVKDKALKPVFTK
jgi:hypothetical protein